MAEDTDPYTGFAPFDDEVEGLEPDEELDAVEDAAEEPEPTAVTAEEEPPPPLGRSWAFDFQGGGFIRGVRGPVELRGLDGLKVWVEKCLRTARGAYAAYSDGYGMDDPVAEIGGPISDFAPEELRQRVEEALTFHPRISGVEGFTTEILEDDDAVVVSFDVLVDDPEAEALRVEAMPLG